MTQRDHREPPSGGFFVFVPMQLTIKFEQFNLTDQNKSLVGETLVNKKLFRFQNFCVIFGLYMKSFKTVFQEFYFI